MIFYGKGNQNHHLGIVFEKKVMNQKVFDHSPKYHIKILL